MDAGIFIDHIEESIGEEAKIHPFYEYEPWDIDEPRPQRIIDLAKEYGISLGTDAMFGSAPSLFQTGYLMSHAFIKVKFAGNQVGKTYNVLIDAIIRLTGEIPLSLQNEKGIVLDKKRSITENNIKRFGRYNSISGEYLDRNTREERTSLWDCGHILGAGKYPKDKIVDAGSKIWIVTYSEALKQVWWPTLRGMVPESLLDIKKGSPTSPGFSEREKICHFINGSTIHFITYEQGHTRLEGAGNIQEFEKLVGIVFDEEPPKKDFYNVALQRAPEITLITTPYNGLCFDPKTEILTNNGWRNIDTICFSDKIATWSDGKISLATCDKIYRKTDYGLMKRMIGQGIDAFVTQNHRWPVSPSTTNKKWKMVETQDLKQSHCIPTKGEFTEWKKENRYPTALIRLLGWMITDGTLPKKKRCVTFYQSKTMYPEKCKEIESLLNELGMRFRRTETPYKKKGEDGIAVRWDAYSPDSAVARRESRRGNLVIEDDDYALILRRLGKNPPVSWLYDLTHKQAVTLFKAMNDGDGTILGKDRYKYTQVDRDQAEFWQTLACLLGYSTSLRTHSTPRGDPVHHVYAAHRGVSNVSSLTITDEPYGGDVWCVSTSAGTVVARRGGKIYISGNSWTYYDILMKAEGNDDIDIFHATRFDCPYKTESEIMKILEAMNKWEIGARIFGFHTKQSGRPYFESVYNQLSEKVISAKPYFTSCEIYPSFVWETPLDLARRRDEIRFIETEGRSSWEIYEMPNPKDSYFCAVDTAEGAECEEDEQDRHAAHMFRLPHDDEPDWPVQCATLDTGIDCDQFAPLCMYGCAAYNNALLAPEAVGKSAGTFIYITHGWPFKYTMVVTNELTKKQTSKYGFFTSISNRTKLFDLVGMMMKECVHLPMFGLRHLKVLAQIFGTIVGKRGRPDHAQGERNDALVACGIGYLIFKQSKEQIQNHVSAFIKKELDPWKSRRHHIKETRPVLGSKRGLDERKRTR